MYVGVQLGTTGERIPQDLLEQYKPQREFLKSLRTHDVVEANRLATIRTLELDQEFAHRRAVRGAPHRELTSEEIKRIACLWAVEQLAMDDQQRAYGYRMYGLDNVRETYEEFLAGWKGAYADGDMSAGAETARRVLKSYGIRLEERSDSFRELSLKLLEEEIRTMEIILQRFDGNPIPTPEAEPVVFRSDESPASSQTIRGLFDYWKLQKQRPPRTIQEANEAVREFERINGVLAAAAYAKSHAVKFRDSLLQEGKLSAATIIKKMSLISAIFETAAKNDKLPSNPFAKVPRPAKGQKKMRGHAYSTQDLAAIFNSKVFIDAGFRPKGGGGEASYWLPLLALWTGARLEEIGQLRTSDVQEEHAVHFINLLIDESRGQSLKNSGSQRRIPIHPELLRCGFLNYVEAMRKAGNDRLFPAVTSSGMRQLTASFSQWWGRYARKEVGIADTKKTFHSFRHAFKDACRNSGVPIDIAQRLMGHTGERGVAAQYGHGYSLAVLADALRKVRYDGLNLSHLVSASAPNLQSAGVANGSLVGVRQERRFG